MSIAHQPSRFDYADRCESETDDGEFPRVPAGARNNGVFAALRPPTSCSTCGGSVPASTCKRHPVLGTICPGCDHAAAEITASYAEGERRQRAEFDSQLKSMVLDRRNGAEVPNFYRGEIA